ncbi:hypothetical protein [Bosea massiliensis]|uniref:Helix-turn-helix domain-containing protein n=1 Tax=Bosea massiliensis TaxID=151419 RepID=A0ABW0NXL6_9HYPH
MSDLAKASNWASADAGPGRVLTDVQALVWKDAEGFRRQRAKWLKWVRRIGDVRLSNMVWLLHVLSAEYMNADNGSAWPSIARLAADHGWSEPTVKRTFGQAVGWGFLIRERRHDSTNRYAMAFSPTVVAQIEERYALRMMPFERDKVGSNLISPPDASAADPEIKPDLTLGSNLISPSDQMRSHPEIKPDPQYLEPIPNKEPEEGYLQEKRLGETETDESPRETLRPSPSPSPAPPARSVPALVDDVDDEPSPAVPVLRDDPEPDPAAQAAFEREVFSWLGEGNVVRGRALADLIPVHMEKIHLAGSMTAAGPMLKQAKTAAISLEQQSQIKKSRVA